jgi:LPXTG-motif cell wall-anchored protein
MPDPIFIETVTFVSPSGAVQPVGGWFKNVTKKLKKVVSIKGVKKLATIKNIAGVAASIVAPGVGSLVVNAAITASDVAKGQQQAKKVKEAAKAAAAKDAAAVKQITDGFATLKAESDKFRAARGLPPLNVSLPDITKSTPEQIEAAFTTLQNDAASIVEAEKKGITVSGDAPGTPIDTTNKTLLYAGGAVVALGLFYFLTRKRK